MRNKYLLMFASMAFIGITADAQTVGISSSAFTPNSASILDVSSTTKGVLLPRMTTAERGTYTTNSSLGATHKGITIFNTTTNRYDYWDGTAWLQLAAVGAAGSDFIQNQTAASQTANFRISGVGIVGNGTAGAPTMTFEGSQTTGLFRPAADQIGFATGAAQRMVLDASGNLGIGTTAPAELLELYKNGSDPILTFHRAGVASYKIGTDNNVLKIAAMDNGYGGHTGSFTANDAQVIAMNTNGNVGIGTIAPNAPFAVRTSNATANARSSSLVNAIGDVSFHLVADRGVTTNNSGDMTMQFGQAYGAASITEGIRFLRGTASGDGALAFATNGSEKIRILTNGNLGVGTTTPSSLLAVGSTSQFQVSSTGNISSISSVAYTWPSSQGGANSTLVNNGSGSLTWTVAGNTGAGLPAGSNGQTLRHNGTSWIANSHLYNDGTNVGIGIAAPISRLDVQGTTARTGTHASGPSFYVTGTLTPGQAGSAPGNIEFRHDNGTQGIGFGYNSIYATGSNVNQDLNLYARGTSHLTLQAYNGVTGNVGVGTTTPNQKLQVAGIVNANSGYNYNNVAVIYNSSTDVYGNIRVLSSQSTLNDGMYINYNSTGGAAADLRLYANGTNERMRILAASGNVGVNSTTPTNRLYVSDVAATMATVNTYQFGIGLSGTTNLTLGSDASFGLLQTWASKPLLVNSQGNNVGIGMTTAPTQRLDVNGGIRSIDYGGAGSVNLMIGDDTYFTDIDVGNMVGLYSASNNALGGLYLGNSGAYIFGATANIGIGNTAPAQKLDVTGNARINNAFIGDVGHGATWAGWAHYSQANTTGYGLLSSSDGNYTLINKQNTGGGYIGFRVANGDVAVITNAGNMGIGTTGPGFSRLYSYQQQTTANGDGQGSIWAYRTRDTQNDGTGYGIYATNGAVIAYNYWGDLYTFGLHGASFGDYTRTGGTLGSVGGTNAWGSLGYKNSGSVNYGVYGSNGYASGGGFMPASKVLGIGGGFAGGVIGSWSMGEVMGSVNKGELFASYNLGNEYTSGYSAEIVEVEGKRVAAYSVTSTDVKVYADGTGSLSGGSVFVPFEGDFAQLLGSKPTVTVSALGSPATLYVQSVSKDGFTVASANGPISTEFMWIAVGRRTDARSKPELPADIANKDFDANMKGVMFNENNKEQSATPVWWDGTRIRFDAAPEDKREKEPEHDPNKGRAKM